jgi:DNA-binding NtrC family response regulator
MNQRPRNVLVVDDEAGMRIALETSFLRRGWKVESARGTGEALARFRDSCPALVVSDVRMPDGDGFELMRQVRQFSPATAVILLTAFGSVADAVAAMREGACDYLVKPVPFDEIERVARRVLQSAAQAAAAECAGKEIHRSEADRCGGDCGMGPNTGDLVGHSPLFLRALQRARQAAASNADILLQAESGTGKELVARMIHRLSERRRHAFVAVNCAAFPETLLESELFGHAKGAFTGAFSARAGKFEQANGGTILLDEAGEMPLALQPKLLRVLQEREFDRLGDTRSVKVDIRVIATTNRSLETMVAEGKFRADLFYRLNVIPLRLPPLRERREDIAELARHFAALYSAPGEMPHLQPEFLDRLQQHNWPGNVRELANLMRRVVALSSGEIGVEALELPAAVEATRLPEDFRAGISLGEMERRLLEMTLDATGGNRSRAAEMLGVSLRTVRNKVREYGLPPRRSYLHD